MPRFLFSLRSFLLFSLLSFSTVYDAEAERDTNAYTITQYTNENGLPQNSVKAIAPDEYGFIWLATEAGLCRFDGRNFFLYNKFNTSGIVSSRILDIWRSPVTNQMLAITEKWSLLDISKGSIAIASKSWSQLYRRISPITLTSSMLHPSWKPKGWHDPYNLDSIQLSLTNQQIVLLTFNGLVQWFKDGKLIGKQDLHSIEKFSTFFTIGNTLYQFHEDPGVNSVSEILPGRINNIPLTGDILKHQQFGNKFVCVNEATNQLFIYRDKCFYLVQRLSNGNLDTRLLLEGFDFEKMHISAGYFDTLHQRIFLGSQINGLFVFSNKIFSTRTYERKEGTDNVFYDLIPYSDSSVLTGKGVLLYANDDQYKLFPKIKLARSMIGSMLYRSEDGSIWTAEEDCVYQFSSDGKNRIAQWHLKGVSAIMQISSGALWLGTDRNGIFTIEPGKSEQPAKLLFANGDYVGCIKQENSDIVWIGTENRLLRYHLSSRKLDTIKELNHKVVRGIYISRTNEVWLCTYEDGLYLYRDNKLTIFPPDRNKFLNTIHYIAEDHHGFFWISTNNGMFQVAKADLFLYMADKNKIPFYLHYTKNAGFNSNEFNGGGQQVGAVLGNGYFAFASMDGVVFLNPDKVRAELPDGPIIIDKIELDGTDLIVRDSIKVKRDFTNIRFRIATAYFGNPENLNMEYRMDNGHWNSLENETFSFNALSAGEHTLYIRKRAGFGNTYNYKSVSISVPPAFYETWIFRIGLVLLCLMLIWLFLQLRLNYFRKKNKLLEEAVTGRTADLKKIINAFELSEAKLETELIFQEKLNKNIAHDIRTPLKYLVLASKYLHAKISKSEMPGIDEVEGLYLSSDRIYRFTDKLIGYMKARQERESSRSVVSLSDMVQQKAEIFKLAAKENRNMIINNIAPDIFLYTYSPIFDILLHNLIDNAVKNTQQGTIIISSRIEDRHRVIIVEDNGKGMTVYESERYNEYLNGSNPEESGQYTGFGFLIIKDILPVLNAKLHISLPTDGGTCFSIYILEDVGP